MLYNNYESGWGSPRVVSDASRDADLIWLPLGWAGMASFHCSVSYRPGMVVYYIYVLAENMGGQLCSLGLNRPLMKIQGEDL